MRRRFEKFFFKVPIAMDLMTTPNRIIPTPTPIRIMLTEESDPLSLPAVMLVGSELDATTPSTMMEYSITKKDRLSYRFFSIADWNYQSIYNVILKI